MILNITDENWAEVIEDTLTVETFTALKKYIHALESSQRGFPDSVTKLVVNEAKCNMKSHEIKQLLDKQPLRRLETISISNPDKYFCTVDGLLYSGDKERLLFCPRGRKGVLVIPDGTKAFLIYHAQPAAFQCWCCRIQLNQSVCLHAIAMQIWKEWKAEKE